ncbi:MAG TPA: thioredoxin family protein [Verrucomicrobiae bacterium]|nr:thioredoxin family protein [Verrucomicrobiae bacterium]
MAQTPSNMLPLGTRAPAFNLTDTVSGKTVSLDAAKGAKGTVVLFICNHCPYVRHINAALVRAAIDYQPRGIAFIAISSNDVVNYPQDSPDQMKAHAKAEGYPFPYLYDASQDVAKAYQAACTPDLYLFDSKLSLVYRGQFDESRPNKGAATGTDLRRAMDSVLAGNAVGAEQQPSVGCNIKWKSA